MTAETESEDFRWKTPVLSDIMSAKEKQATRSGICLLWKIQKIKGEHNAVTGLGTV